MSCNSCCSFDMRTQLFNLHPGITRKITYLIFRNFRSNVDLQRYTSSTSTFLTALAMNQLILLTCPASQRFHDVLGLRCYGSSWGAWAKIEKTSAEFASCNKGNATKPTKQRLYFSENLGQTVLWISRHMTSTLCARECAIDLPTLFNSCNIWRSVYLKTSRVAHDTFLRTSATQLFHAELPCDVT